MPGELERVHATAIAAGRRVALIRGPSGSGKSDLALRCLALGPSSILKEPVRIIADDQVILTRQSSGLIATTPETLRGKLEVRGAGILDVAWTEAGDVVLVADLVPEGAIERFPDPWPKARILGFDIPLIKLRPFEASAAAKLVACLVMAGLPLVEPKA